MKKIFLVCNHLRLNELRKQLLLVSIFLVTILLPDQVRAQNYIVNYFGMNLNARDIVYYPAEKLFMVNSASDGQLGYVNSEGQYQFLLKSNLLVGATAMKIRGNILYALINTTGTSDMSVGANQPKLVKFNLATNKIQSTYELGKLFNGLHYVTDLTLDPDGGVYIVDALSPVIYKISKNDEGSVFFENVLLGSKTGEIKSVAYHKHEYLLVSTGREILKIDLKTKAILMVSVETDFDNINSLQFTKEYLLVVAEGENDGKIHILNTSNSWLSGTVLRTDNWNYNNPVNMEFVDNRIYVLDSDAQLNDPADFSVRVIDLNKLPTNKKRKARVIAGDVTVLRKDF